MPRLGVRQTSDHAAGQVYVPQVSWLLAAAVIALVLGFGSSDRLANAYGIAVAGGMTVTTLPVTVVARGRWGLPWPAALAVGLPLLALDLAFVSGNLHKIPAGGWFPLLVGAAALTLMLVWRRGRAVLLAGRVLPVGRASAAGFAGVRAARRAMGRPVALVAATALGHGIGTVATRNVPDFEDVGLAVLDPWSFGP